VVIHREVKAFTPSSHWIQAQTKDTHLIPLINEWEEPDLLHKFPDEPVEFKERPVEAQHFRKITHHFSGICGIYLSLIKEKPKDVNMQLVGFGNTRISTNYRSFLATWTENN
jgi:hypothetical protein